MYCEVGCIFPMVISSEFRMGQYRDDDHSEDAPHFILNSVQFCSKFHFYRIFNIPVKKFPSWNSVLYGFFLFFLLLKNQRKFHMNWISFLRKFVLIRFLMVINRCVTLYKNSYWAIPLVFLPSTVVQSANNFFFSFTISNKVFLCFPSSLRQ